MSKPNILFIFSDQHNANVMGCAGDPYINTPNLDKLAAQGVRMTDCSCNAPLCVPSRSSLLTGLLPSEHRSLNNFQTLSPDIPTIAHTMGIAGYETVLAGRMHFSGPDQNHGFEQRLVGDVTPVYHGLKSFPEVFEDYVESFKQKRYTLDCAGPGHSALLDYDQDVAQAAEDYMANRTDSRPLFMTVGLITPHPPLMCDRERYEYYYNLLPEIQTDPAFHETLHPYVAGWMSHRGLDDVPEEEKRAVRAAYYAHVEFMDGVIGHIIDKAKEVLGPNTLIVYSSDHGECMGINNLYWKGTFYENSIKVPLIFSMPGVLPEGTTCSDPCDLFDLTATLVDVSDAKPLPGMRGESLIPVIKGEKQLDPNRPILGQLGSYPATNDGPSGMIRRGRYKLIKYSGYDFPAFFDLETDPMEVHDLGRDPAYAEIREAMEKELDSTWDIEAETEYCKRAFEWFLMSAEWVNQTKFHLPEYWTCKKGTNYSEKQMAGEITCQKDLIGY